MGYIETNAFGETDNSQKAAARRAIFGIRRYNRYPELAVEGCQLKRFLV